MNLPNKLTILRVILVPLFMILYLIDQNILSAIVFIIASLTDWADGYIARKNNIVTNFGKIMDPLADKLMVTGALLCLLGSSVVSVWVVIIILARDFLVSGIRMVAASGGVVIAAGKLGKIKTVIQIIAMVVAILVGKTLVTDILIYASVIITVVSGITYLLQNKEVWN